MGISFCQIPSYGCVSALFVAVFLILCGDLKCQISISKCNSSAHGDIPTSTDGSGRPICVGKACGS